MSVHGPCPRPTRRSGDSDVHASNPDGPDATNTNPFPDREAALLASIANLQHRAQRRLQQMSDIRSETRVTLGRMQRAQRTFDALLAASSFSLVPGPTSPEGPPGDPSVRSPSRPRNSR